MNSPPLITTSKLSSEGTGGLCTVFRFRKEFNLRLEFRASETLVKARGTLSKGLDRESECGIHRSLNEVEVGDGKSRTRANLRLKISYKASSANRAIAGNTVAASRF